MGTRDSSGVHIFPVVAGLPRVVFEQGKEGWGAAEGANEVACTN